MRENTKMSLQEEKEPAALLHLVCTLLFYYSTGQFLNAPGRCVPNILEFLRADLKEEVFTKLVYFQSKNLAPINPIKSKRSLN